ncbi:MAG: DNA glycosylase, partial [Candidatus Micrarchaeota archaeon]
MPSFAKADIDLRLVLTSGQVFNWRESSGTFHVAHSGRIIRLSQPQGLLRYGVFPPRPDSARFVSDFLGLGRDLPGELSEFSGDSALMRSVSACRGLKLT